MRRAIFQGLVGLMAIAVPPSAALAQLVTGPGNALGDVNGDGVRDIRHSRGPGALEALYRDPSRRQALARAAIAAAHDPART